MKKLNILIMLMLLLASCSKDAFDNNSTGTGIEVTAHFSFTTKSMIQKLLGDARAVTRSTVASTVNDTQLTDMWVVQFDNSGNFIKKSYTASVNPTSFDVPLQANVAGATSTIYFLANIGSTLVSPNGGEAAFKTQVMSIATESNLLPTGSPLKSVPMIGSVTGITVPAAGYINNTSVQLTRLLAQIDITTTVDPSFASNFILEKIRVCNVPNGVQFCTPAAATTTPKTSAGVTGYINLPYETTTSGSTVTFYLPENQQGVGGNTAATDERLKSGVANATYIDMMGHTTGAQGGDEVHYYVYLGGDIMNNYNIIRNTHYTLSPTLKGMNTADSRIYVKERSNCYVLQTVDPTTNSLGQVNIPIKHANDSGLGTQVGDVRTVTASQITTSWQTAISTNNMLTYDTSNLAKGYFTVKYNYASFATTPGDAVVALKDASGNILWTWHIWMVTPANDPTLPANQLVANGNTWMKFNLGACNLPGTGPNWASLTGGLQYQWGRKDPFPCSDNIGSGVVGGAISNYTLPTFSSPSLTVIPIGEGAVRYYDVSANYTNALLCSVRYPLLFMNKWSGGTATAAADAGGIVGADSWGGNYGQPKNIAYDPCPEGYRVPSFFKTSSTATSPWAGMAWNYVTSGGTSSCYGTDTSASAYGAYGICGGRDANYGKFYTVGSNGNYWSASVTGTAGFSFLLTTADVTPASSSSRASGYNVRCVKSW